MGLGPDVTSALGSNSFAPRAHIQDRSMTMLHAKSAPETTESQPLEKAQLSVMVSLLSREIETERQTERESDRERKGRESVC